jgi:hypothetical protein
MQHRVLGALLLELTFAPDTLLLDLVRLLVALVLDRLLARVVLRREHEPDDRESRQDYEKWQPKLPTVPPCILAELHPHSESSRSLASIGLVGLIFEVVVEYLAVAGVHLGLVTDLESFPSKTS